MEELLVWMAVVTLGVIASKLWKWISPEEQARRAQAAQETYRMLQEAIGSLFTGEYLAASEVEAWRAQHKDALSRAANDRFALYLPSPQAQEAREWCRQLRQLPETVRRYNQEFLARRLAEERDAIDRVERYPLTERQRIAIVTNEDTTLVMAGAGTGKTSTIIGKVDYLVRRGLARPEEILVVAFARKAAEELKARLNQLGRYEQVDVSTFHALGLRIVAEVEGVRPSLSPMAEDDGALRRFLRDRVRAMLADPHDAKLLITFFSAELDETGEALTGDAYIRAQRARGLRALDGTKLKSQEEVQIANWLTLNGIAWEYEREYPYQPDDPKRRRYRPDFYLPEYDLYLEHFGIDRDGNTAPHIDRDEYQRAMQWKRELHRTHGTTLVETYSYFKDEEGGLIGQLEALLRRHGVVPRPLTPDEIDAITAEANRPFSDFVTLVAQFLALYKGNGLTDEAVRRKATSRRDRAFLDVFRKLYLAYEHELARTRQIDFHDMINRARAAVQNGPFRSPYRYLIVDEFQDISENRLGLLQDLRAQQPHARLFVVGDDWQSIFRFTGSDATIIPNLDKRVGATERVDLDITFRYHQELLDFSSGFITANPHQLRKTLRAHDGPGYYLPVCVIFDSARSGELQLSTGVNAVSPLELACQDILARQQGEPATLFVLGRYTFSRPDEFDRLRRWLDAKGIEAEFLTAHASKGKEADYVIVVGLEAGEYGFPSNVADDPVMQMVLSEVDDYPYAEERRLFYVAVTRARKRVYLISSQDNPSPFILPDILDGPLRNYVETVGEVSECYRCPSCGGRTIRRTTGTYGVFWACSHYPLCYGKLDACPRCKDGGLEPVEDGRSAARYRCIGCGYEPEPCPQCQRGYLRERWGRHGPFLGCSRWTPDGGCQYTRNL